MKPIDRSVSNSLVSLVLTALLCLALPLPLAAAPAAGVVTLPAGGGVPGSVYMAFVAAAYQKNYGRLCELMAPPAEVELCRLQEDVLDAYMQLFTQPTAHRVLGGTLQGDEATLQVVYSYAEAPEATGSVAMKETDGRWIVASFGSTGSGEVGASAGGEANPGSGAVSGSADSGGAPPEFADIKLEVDKEGYSGSCPAEIAFTALIAFREPLPQQMTYHWELSSGDATRETTVTPSRSGQMSLRQVWKGGSPGEELDASVRFVAAADGATMVKDSPVVRVVCR